MSTRMPPDFRLLDERLTGAFAGLDVSPGFDARLTARVARESERDFAERLGRARRLEQERYRSARLHRGWRLEFQALLRVFTLETVGAAVLVALAATALSSPFTAWADGQMPEVTDVLRQNATLIWPSLLGIVLGLCPLVLRRLRRPHLST